MEADEVLQWQYYLASEPRCWNRLDYNTAQICQSVYQTLISFSGSQKKSINLDECLLKFIDPNGDKSIENRKRIKEGMAMLQAFGGKIDGVDKLKEDLRKLQFDE